MIDVRFVSVKEIDLARFDVLKATQLEVRRRFLDDHGEEAPMVGVYAARWSTFEENEARGKRARIRAERHGVRAAALVHMARTQPDPEKWGRKATEAAELAWHFALIAQQCGERP